MRKDMSCLAPATIAALARAAIVSLALLGCAAAAPAKAADGPYLFDLLKRPAYKASWTKMLAGARPPSWLVRFSQIGDGVATPSVIIAVDGVPYELAHVCKPHDCADHRFQVLFTRGGALALGALREDNRPLRFFGAPSPAQKRALQNAIAD